MRGTQTFGGGSAVATSYDNSTSGLTATNVQAAIDELSEYGKPTDIGGWLFCWNVPGFGLIVRIPMDCTRYALQVGSNPQVFYNGAWQSLSAATFENNNRGSYTDIVVVNSGVPSTFQGQALLISLGLTVVSR